VIRVVCFGDSPVAYGFCHCGCGQKTRLAHRNFYQRGWIKGEPLRFISGHNAARTGTGLALDDGYVERDCGYRSPCWVWTYGHDPNGYGMKRVGRTNRRAHVVLWEREHGPVPAGRQLDHLCRNRTCVNPDHLEPVTHAENCRRGAQAILSKDDVRVIRARIDRGEGNQIIASDFGVTHYCISDIRRGKSWRGIS
jgi:hypothetical protein